MTKLIDSLTRKQKQLLPKTRDEWLAIGLRTGGDVDRAEARKAIDAVYAAATKPLPPPTFLIVLDSPLALPIGSAIMRSMKPSRAQVVAQVVDQVRDQVWAQVRAQVGDQVRAQVGDQVRDQVVDQVGDQVWDQVRDQVGDQVRAQVWDQVRDQVVDQVRAQVRAQVRDQVWAQVRDQVGDQVNLDALFLAQHEAGWLSWMSTFDRLGLECVKRVRPLMQLAQVGCWWSLWKGAALVCHRPDFIHRDDRNRMHCENGPAIRWRDGFAIWAWHGTVVSQQVIEKPETLTVEAIKAEKNAEVRRIMRERFGDGRYLTETSATVVDVDVGGSQFDPTPRALLRDDAGDLMLVGTDGGTGRTYFMPCPSNMKTCRQAHEALCGFPETEILFGS